MDCVNCIYHYVLKGTTITVCAKCAPDFDFVDNCFTCSDYEEKKNFNENMLVDNYEK